MRRLFAVCFIILLLNNCTSILSKMGKGRVDGEVQEMQVKTQGIGPHKALVIGNTSYQYSPLQSPVNDAKAMTHKLVKMGFQVIQGINLDHQTMRKVVQKFENNLSGREVALFYFSGHGAQVDGENFLLPIDNKKIREDNLKDTAVSVQTLLVKMKEVNQGLNLLILDACRNNSYVTKRRCLTYNCACHCACPQMTPPKNTLIAFAAVQGQLPCDESSGGINSLYTSHLLKALDNARHKRIEDVLMSVRESVYEKSGRTQEPWYQASLREPFCFGGCFPQ